MELPHMLRFHCEIRSKELNQSINQSIETNIPHIDNKVEHIQEEIMLERGKLKCNTYIIRFPHS